jgi:uncharacterized membrane protein
MSTRLRFLVEQIVHDLRVGLLLRPGVIIAGLSTLAVALPRLEHASAAVPERLAGLALFHGEPATAQLVLATIASSMVTVVSIVYSVLLMALSLASIQFSPRVLSRFVRDDASQTTLGIFVGTFVYCLLVLPSVGGQAAFVPVLSISVALVLALLGLAYLVYFIHHISKSIQVNYIVDVIAADTEHVIDEVFPAPFRAGGEGDEEAPQSSADAARVGAPDSGYVQLLDEEGLTAIAVEHALDIVALRGVGDYVPEGAALLTIAPVDRATDEVRAACAATFDIGPIRTMQQDVDYGIRQIVDIGLKAISPAVNDPSTANTCIDQLSRLLSRLAARDTRPTRGRVRFHRPTFVSVLDLAFNQLRQYGRHDLAVSIRILGALRDIAEVALDPEGLARILHHAELVAGGCTEHAADERSVLTLRLSELRAIVADRSERPAPHARTRKLPGRRTKLRRTTRAP